MTIYQRALDFVNQGDLIGLGSGRAASSFVRSLGASGKKVRAVPTSEATAVLARSVGIEVVSLDVGLPLALTVDGADEVDSSCNLIKGFGRALVREKIVACSSQQLIILVGKTKTVSRLGARGKLPIEVLPFALPLFQAWAKDRGFEYTLDVREGKPFLSDNGNFVIDLHLSSHPFSPLELDTELRGLPGVVGNGFFLNMASLVLIGDEDHDFALVEERAAPRGTV